METIKSIGKWACIIICIIVVFAAAEHFLTILTIEQRKYIYVMMGLNTYIIYIRLAAKCMVIGYLQLNCMRLVKMAIHYVKSVKKTTI